MCRYKKTNLIEECEEEEEGAETDLFVGVIETNRKQVNSVKEWVQKIKIKGSEVECKVDTGAEVNILNMKTVKRLNAKVRTSKTCDVSLVLDSYKFLFEGIGELSVPYEIKLKKKYRKIPISIVEGVKKELDMMESQKIIRKVTEPTEWCSSLVTVKKPEGLRLCLDPRNLNKAIVREWYQLPTFEELASKMAGAKVFSISDGNKGFYQIKLAAQSQLLSTFNAGSFGTYCYQVRLLQ
ncbi:hypothetical protein QE152_g24698 [Popillia japonica]|uniref:Uncharacterized protein n=1 Tax=Popillia japonica TaxID=7064 RepID=A0AAW1K4T8_POPJA